MIISLLLDAREYKIIIITPVTLANSQVGTAFAFILTAQSGKAVVILALFTLLLSVVVVLIKMAAVVRDGE